MGKAKASSKSPVDDRIVMADGEPLDLRNRTLAAVLAWLIPGAGHFYQQRYFKSAIFSTAVFSTFILGMFLAGTRCVYASWNVTEKRWQYALQAGIGLPAMPAAIQAWSIRSGNEPIFGSFMAPPQSERELDSWNHDTASGFDMGTLYTMIAGLLNVLVVFDAYSGPLPPPVPKKKKDKDQENEDAESAELKPSTSTSGKGD